MRCRLLPRLSGVGDPGHVALTFDDGPDPTLDPAHPRRPGGPRLARHLLLPRQPGAPLPATSPGSWSGRGHEVAVHGDSHRSHLRRPLHLDGSRRPPGPRHHRGRGRGTRSGGFGRRTGRCRQPRWWRPGGPGCSWSSGPRGASTGKPHATGRTVAANVARTFHPGATVLLHDSDITSIPRHLALHAGRPSAPRPSSGPRPGLTVGTLGEHGVGVYRPAVDGRAGRRGPAPAGPGRVTGGGPAS